MRVRDGMEGRRQGWGRRALAFVSVLFLVASTLAMTRFSSLDATPVGDVVAQIQVSAPSGTDDDSGNRTGPAHSFSCAHNVQLSPPSCASFAAPPAAAAIYGLKIQPDGTPGPPSLLTRPPRA